MKFQRLFSLIILFQVISVMSFSQLSVGAKYDRLSIYNGLSSNSVSQSIQDEEGYIWFATANGLDRYDGKNVKQFRHNPKDSNSISHINITCLLIDRDGVMWIGTDGGGLNIKNNDGTFTAIGSNSGDHSIPNNFIESLFEDSQGRIWIATHDGISVHDKKKNNFLSYVSDPNDPESLPVKTANSFYEDSYGNVWVGTWGGGISVFVPPGKHNQSGKVKFKHLNDPLDNSLSILSFSNIFEDDFGGVWVQQVNGNLAYVDFPKGKNILDCRFSEIKFVPRILVNNKDHIEIIYSSTMVKGEGLYLNTLSGLYFIKTEDLKSDSRTSFDGLADFIGSIDLSKTRGNDFFKDKSGMNWISTNNGVYKLFGGSSDNFQRELESYCEENNTVVMCFLRDHMDRLWVGTGADLLIVDGENEVEIIEDNGRGRFKLEHVSSLYEDEDGFIWAGTLGGDLFSVNTKDGKIEFHPIPKLNVMESNHHIWKISNGPDGRLWLGTHQGLIFYDKNTGVSKAVDAEKYDIAGGNVFDIVKDERNDYWVSYTGGGVLKVGIEDEELVCTQLVPDAGNPNRLKNSVVFDLEIVGDILWIGTETGIEKYDILKDSFYFVEALELNVTNTVLSISVDEDNVLWMATHDGLIAYNEENNIISKFNEFDGVSEKMSIMASYKDKTGKMYFGGASGYNSFQGAEMLNTRKSIEVVFTDLKLNNKSAVVNNEDEVLGAVVLSEKIQQASEVQLSYKHHAVSLNFAVQDYVDPYQYIYSYKREGIDKDWVHLGNNNSVTWSNLPKKCFVLNVRAQNKYGFQSESAQLMIHVKQPLLSHNGVRFFIIILCIGALTLYMRYHEKGIINRNLELEKVVQERTNELLVKNKKLEDYIESNIKLEQFAHAASHDLKTPLRTISSYTGLLKRKLINKMDDREKDHLEQVETGTKRLYDLVEDLLSYSKINSDSLNLVQLDANELVSGVLNQIGQGVIDAKAEIVVNELPKEIWLDDLKISRVFQNLLTNCMKFVSKESSPVIEINAEEQDRHWIFSIKDNGIGIGKDNLQSIFDIFKRVAHSNHYDGTGMGLSMCKKIVEDHGGKIWVDSEMNQGSIFYFTIPKIK